MAGSCPPNAPLAVLFCCALPRICLSLTTEALPCSPAPLLPQKLYAEGGVPRLFRGFSPCLMRAVPANGVMLFTVDKVTHMLNPHH